MGSVPGACEEPAYRSRFDCSNLCENPMGPESCPCALISRPRAAFAKSRRGDCAYRPSLSRERHGRHRRNIQVSRRRRRRVTNRALLSNHLYFSSSCLDRPQRTCVRGTSGVDSYSYDDGGICTLVACLAHPRVADGVYVPAVDAPGFTRLFRSAL